MNCAAFERRLDERGPDGLGGDALAHAAECARCARTRRDARAIEVLLSAPPAGQASEDFTRRVMARVDDARREAFVGRAPFVPDAVLPPLWLRLLAEPAVLLSLGLAAVLALAAGPGLAALGAFAASLAREPAATGAASDPASWAPWLVAAWLLALAAAPLVRWAERLAAPHRAR